MCGIGGIVSFNNSVIDQNISEKIKSSLNHRGPDHSSIKVIDSNCTFVHSRLSIIDLNPRSNQPFSSEDGRYNIVFNGEIYNYKELKNELITQGHNFKTEGDTEVLLAGYQHYGKEILSKLIGQFAFVIADYNKNIFFMARDRIGLKPLYYSIGKEYLIFSSEFNAINDCGLINFSPNRESYISYLRHLAVPGYSTGNENINKVQPGEYIEIDFDGNVENHSYWSPFNFINDIDISYDEAIDKLDKLLLDSVEYRKISDVEVGLYLSGGLDSTLIGSLLSFDTKIKSFNVDFDETFDGYEGELNEAKFSANQINVDLIHKSITFEEFKSIISNYSYYQDDLIGDEVGIPLYFLGKLAKSNGLKVVQVGEGADELFYGYEHWQRFVKLYKNIPKISKPNSNNYFKSHRPNLLFNIIQNSNPFPGGAVGFNLTQIDKLVNYDLASKSNLINFSDNLWEDYLLRENFSITKWMTLVDLKIRLPELLLMKMDKFSMQSGVEVRVPFLDHRIVEFVLSLPEHIIFDLKRTKPLLKDLSKRYIPEKIFNRKKQGFRAPISNWIQKDPKYFHDTIHCFNTDFNFFHPNELKRILKHGDDQKVWYIYNLANWHLSRVKK